MVVRMSKKNIICYFILLSMIFIGKLVFAAEKNADFEGLLEPSEVVNVGSAAVGVVERILVERSALVKQGDPLVLLESSVEKASVEKAKASAAADGDVKVFEEKLAHARRMHARADELYKSEAISAEKKDEAVTEMALATSGLQKAREDKQIAKLDYDRAQAQLNQRTIRSPITGVVVERLISSGEFAGNKPLLRLAQLNPLRVEVILPSSMFQKIQIGMKAEVRLDQQSDKPYMSTVTLVDRVIDPASGTFGARLELPNADYSLPSGLKCSIHFVY